MGFVALRSTEEIAKIRESCRIVAESFDIIKAKIAPGVLSKDLDSAVEEYILSQNGRPAFKGYRGYPATTCISIDDQVVHGIPNSKPLKDGMIVSIDIGVRKDGFYGDAARTFSVGRISEEKNMLIQTTKESLYKGIEQAVEGNKLSNISCAIQDYVEDRGYSVVRSLVGHGVGAQLHEPPEIPNFWDGGHNDLTLKEGMVFAIEPMINIGDYEVKMLMDGWTIVTQDGTPSAHYEHTIVVKKNKAEILSEV